MTAAPRLGRRDVASGLEKIYGSERSRFLVAFHGTGDEDVVDVAGGPVRVIPVGCELELRRRLLSVGGQDRVAFLVPWTVAMPVDLQGRFAKSGRVFRVGREPRLLALFNATELDDEARACPLGDHLLAHHVTDAFSVPGGRLTAAALWAAWLDRAFGVGAGGELALDVLLGWAAVDGRGAQLAAALEARGAGAVREALLAHLAARLGPAGPLVWKAWEAGRGAAALELAVVLAALAGVDDPAVRMWLRLEAPKVLGEAPDEALTRLGAVADTALRAVERRSGPAAVRALLLAADQRAALPELRPHLLGSNRLPSAWRGRLERLGEALRAAAATPGVAAARRAIEDHRALTGHDLFAEPEHTATVLRAEMAVRLCAWLAVRPDRELPRAVTPYGDVEALAAWYVREGGYLDRARRAARGTAGGAFGEGVAAVLTAVDAAREGLDVRFARALPAWHEARRPALHVIPIDQAVKRVASAFLEEDPQRRLLVILMDGMAWAQAVELLESMGGRAAAWGPLAWHGIGKHRLGDAPYPPVLTNFPTVTEISRSAFFAGKPMPAGRSPVSSDDPKRWQENREVTRFSPGDELPALLLRGEGQTRDGSASEPALSLVADRGRRLVAVVVNTIDMALKGDPGHRHRWTVEAVKALRDLLDKAAEVGRAVLLASDHGHVPADRLEASGAAMKDGARWRGWQSAGDPVAPYEVGLPAGDGVWAPKGAHGVVLVADDAHRYGGGASAGEHGGASLAEVVAPCVLIGSADHPGAGDDAGQRVRPVRAPGWWHFDLGPEAAPVGEPGQEPEKRPARKSKPVVAEAQLPLPALAPPPPPPAPEPRVEPEAPLARSEIFRARVKQADRREVLVAVAFLAARSGVASAAAFGQELGLLPRRVGGLVAKLQEALNVDGYVILRFDRAHQEVHLDVAKLAQQFGLELTTRG